MLRVFFIFLLAFSATSSLRANKTMFVKQKNIMELVAGAASLFKKAFIKRELGIMALVIRDDKILLVEHTYKKGWWLIGGGVEPGEAPEDTVVREVYEEAGVKMKTSPKIFNLYHRAAKGKDSYTAVYLCTDFDVIEGVKSLEIKRFKWFNLSDLPKGISSFSNSLIKKYKESLKS